MVFAPPDMQLHMIQRKLSLELLHCIDRSAAEDADYRVTQLARCLGGYESGAASIPNLCSISHPWQTYEAESYSEAVITQHSSPCRIQRGAGPTVHLICTDHADANRDDGISLDDGDELCKLALHISLELLSDSICVKDPTRDTASSQPLGVSPCTPYV